MTLLTGKNANNKQLLENLNTVEKEIMKDPYPCFLQLSNIFNYD